MTYRFGAFELDTPRFELRRDGAPVPLEPQVFELLALFVSRAGELVTRDEMIDAVWGGRIVSEATISSRVNAVRRALGDDGRRQAMLRTVPRRGFRFVAPVESGDRAAPMTTLAGGDQTVRVARSADGTRIAYAVSGAGPLLLRAGHFLTHLERDWHSPIWRPLLDQLGTRFTVIRYDQRGTGLSDREPGDLDLDRLTEDLRAVADAAGLERFPIFAASQGVPVSLAFAARHPERVSRLALYGGYVEGRSRRGSGEDLERASAILTMIREGWGVPDSPFATAFATLYLPDAGREERESIVATQLASATPAGAVALRQAIDAFDVSARLGQVAAPALVLHARGDAVQPVSEALRLAEGLPDARLRILDSRNHVPVPTDPAWREMTEAVIGFLSEG
jgi:DNA-binding winged helix-turn-helix (wHTH) protein/alpha-beta hydrolase superfamily lysophospholipase